MHTSSGKTSNDKGKKKKKIRMSKMWDINGRPNQSSVNMKLCNRPKKSNWSGCLVWRWLLKVTFPSLSSWNLSKSNKKNLKQKCKLHFRRNLETTKIPVHVIGKRTVISREFEASVCIEKGCRREKVPWPPLSERNSKAPFFKRRGTLAVSPRKTAMQQSQRATMPDRRKHTFRRDGSNSKKKKKKVEEQLHCYMLLAL